MPLEGVIDLSAEKARLVKEIAMLGGDVSPFLPPTVLAKLYAKLRPA